MWSSAQWDKEIGLSDGFCQALSDSYRPYAYDVTEGRPRVLGVKRSTATCTIAKHAASGLTPACHTAGLARARTLTERLSANALCQHNTCAQRDKSWPAPTWRRCYGWRQCIRSIGYCNNFWFHTNMPWGYICTYIPMQECATMQKEIHPGLCIV